MDWNISGIKTLITVLAHFDELPRSKPSHVKGAVTPHRKIMKSNSQ